MKPTLPLSIGFVIKNPTKKPLNAVIFGHDQFLLAPNYGSDEDIEILPNNNALTYGGLLLASARTDFRSSFFMIKATSEEQAQEIIHHNYNGSLKAQVSSNPVFPQDHIHGSQKDKTAVLLQYSCDINAENSFQVKILPESQLGIVFYDQKLTSAMMDTYEIEQGVKVDRNYCMYSDADAGSVISDS